MDDLLRSGALGDGALPAAPYRNILVIARLIFEVIEPRLGSGMVGLAGSTNSSLSGLVRGVKSPTGTI